MFLSRTLMRLLMLFCPNEDVNIRMIQYGWSFVNFQMCLSFFFFFWRCCGLIILKIVNAFGHFKVIVIGKRTYEFSIVNILKMLLKHDGLFLTITVLYLGKKISDRCYPVIFFFFMRWDTIFFNIKQYFYLLILGLKHFYTVKWSK